MRDATEALRLPSSEFGVILHLSLYAASSARARQPSLLRSVQSARGRWVLESAVGHPARDGGARERGSKQRAGRRGEAHGAGKAFFPPLQRARCCDEKRNAVIAQLLGRDSGQRLCGGKNKSIESRLSVKSRNCSPSAQRRQAAGRRGAGAAPRGAGGGAGQQRVPPHRPPLRPSRRCPELRTNPPPARHPRGHVCGRDPGAGAAERGGGGGRRGGRGRPWPGRA